MLKQSLTQTFKPLKVVLWSGVLLSMLISSALYALLHSFLEAIRWMSVLNQLDFWFLDPLSRVSYSTSVASFSVVFGQSVGLQYIVKSLSRKKSSRRHQLRYALNDQSNLTWYSLFWLTSFVFYLSILFYTLGPINSGLMDHKKVGFIVFLISLMLFLNNWVGLLRIYRNKIYKWIGLALVFNLLFIGLLSRWSPIENDFIDKSVRNSLPQLNYPLEYPTVVNGHRVVKRSLISSLFIQLDERDSVVIIGDAKKIKLNDVCAFLSRQYNSYQESYRPYTKTILAADKKLKAGQFVPIVIEVCTNSAKIAFAVNDKSEKSKNVQQVIQISYPPQLYFPDLPQSDISNESDTLRIINDETWTINNNIVSDVMLRKTLQNKLESGNFYLAINYDSSLDLQSYLHTYDVVLTELLAYRTRQAKQNFNADYERESIMKQREMNDQFSKISLIDVPILINSLTNLSD